MLSVGVFADMTTSAGPGGSAATFSRLVPDLLASDSADPMALKIERIARVLVNAKDQFRAFVSFVLCSTCRFHLITFPVGVETAVGRLVLKRRNALEIRLKAIASHQGSFL
jgi:hypothetical protein